MPHDPYKLIADNGAPEKVWAATSFICGAKDALNHQDDADTVMGWKEEE